MKTKRGYKKVKWIINSVVLVGLSIGSYFYYDYMFGYEKGVNPMFNNDVSFVEMSFNASDGYEFHASNGTHLSIPPMAFVTKHGKLVNGEINVKFREFHDAKSILLSGIPMQLNENRDEYMQSAGMMELRAFKGREELIIQNGKYINVSLAAENKVDKNFKLYKLNNNEQWLETGSFKTDSNQYKIDGLASIPSLPVYPKNPNPGEDDFVFTLSMDMKNSPYLKAFKGVKWVMKKQDDGKLPLKQLRTGWDNIKVKKIDDEKNIFQITFSRQVSDFRTNSSRKEKFCLNAVPALKGKKLENAMATYESDLEEYETLLALKEMEEERLSLENDMVNSFRIESLGIWNCDRLNNTNYFAKGTYEFDFEDSFLPFVNKLSLYVVLNDQNGVLMYHNTNWSDVPFFVDENVELFAVLPDLSVAHVSPSEYSKNVNKSSISKHFTNKVKFITKKVSKKDAFAYINNLRESLTPELADSNF